METEIGNKNRICAESVKSGGSEVEFGTPNLSDMDTEGLETFKEELVESPLALLERFFPNRRDNDLMAVVGDLVRFCGATLHARWFRLRGKIAPALRFEKTAQKAYDALPEWARW